MADDKFICPFGCELFVRGTKGARSHLRRVHDSKQGDDDDENELYNAPTCVPVTQTSIFSTALTQCYGYRVEESVQAAMGDAAALPPQPAPPVDDWFVYVGNETELVHDERLARLRISINHVHKFAACSICGVMLENVKHVQREHRVIFEAGDTQYVHGKYADYGIPTTGPGMTKPKWMEMLPAMTTPASNGAGTLTGFVDRPIEGIRAHKGTACTECSFTTRSARIQKEHVHKSDPIPCLVQQPKMDWPYLRVRGKSSDLCLRYVSTHASPSHPRQIQSITEPVTASRPAGDKVLDLAQFKAQLCKTAIEDPNDVDKGDTSSFLRLLGWQDTLDERLTKDMVVELFKMPLASVDKRAKAVVDVAGAIFDTMHNEAKANTGNFEQYVAN